VDCLGLRDFEQGNERLKPDFKIIFHRKIPVGRLVFDHMFGFDDAVVVGENDERMGEKVDQRVRSIEEQG